MTDTTTFPADPDADEVEVPGTITAYPGVLAKDPHWTAPLLMRMTVDYPDKAPSERLLTVTQARHGWTVDVWTPAGWSRFGNVVADDAEEAGAIVNAILEGGLVA